MFVYAVAFAHVVVLALHVLLLVFTYFLVLTHDVASVIFAFTVLLAAHVVLALVTVITGSTVSNLYVPFHVCVFHAASLTHKYNVFSHSVLYVIVHPLLKLVPLLVQSTALVHEYFA